MDPLLQFGIKTNFNPTKKNIMNKLYGSFSPMYLHVSTDCTEDIFPGSNLTKKAVPREVATAVAISYPYLTD